MIIFDLDGTLADCEHRRHLVDIKYHLEKFKDPPNNEDPTEWVHNKLIGCKANWPAFFEACDKDEPIDSTITVIKGLLGRDYYANDEDVHIWSGRCESVRKKTEEWLDKNYIYYNDLKMRPVGDNTPDYVLKEKWLDEVVRKKRTVEFVFDSDPKSIEMWKLRGIFVFDCNQLALMGAK